MRNIMSDISKACAISLAYTVATGISASIESFMLFVTASAVFGTILYMAWRSDRTEKRLKRYQRHADEELRISGKG